MKSSTYALGLALFLGSFALGDATQAQSITADSDSIGTVVTQTDNQYDITGGTSGGNNLYHSFEQFGLTAGEVANFITNPNTANILGRVTGGNASVIDGLLQVSGSNANLFLLNPAGILLGPNSALNLNGSFTATTASGIGEEDSWFNVVGDNSYSALVGNPNQLAFGDSPAAVVNHGNLTVNVGESVTLVGGSVLNTGTITAPGGDITITAVPGQSLVNLAQDGLVISLDLPTADAIPAADLAGFSPLDLPALLTAGATANATDVTVNADGTITLSGSRLDIPAEANTSIAAGTLDASSSTSGIGGTVQVLGEQVALLDGTIDVSGTNGGGEVLIGGEFQGNGTLPNAERTYVGETVTILADALTDGDGGRVIVWADDATQFYGDISTTGGTTAGDGGFVEVSGARSLDFQGNVDTAAPLGKFGTLLLDPSDITVQVSGGNTGGATTLLFADTPANAIVETGTINGAAANVVLQATNSITFANAISITTPGIGLTVQTTSGDITLNADIVTIGGNLVLEAGGSITADGITTAGGAVTLSASNSITVNNIQTNSSGSGGTVSLTAGTDITVDGSIDSSGGSPVNSSGDIAITAGQFVRLTGASIDSGDNTNFPIPGDITIIHGGTEPFIFGDASINGSTATIGNHIFTLGDVLASPTSLFTSFNLGGTAAGNIDIIPATDLDPCPNSCFVPNTDLPKPLESGGVINLAIIPDASGEAAYKDFENNLTDQFANHLGLSSDITNDTTSLVEAQAALARIKEQTGQNPAVIFLVFGTGSDDSVNTAPLEMLLVTSSGEPTYLRVPEASRNQVLTMAQRLRRQISNINRVGSDSYLEAAQTLYQWMIAPFEEALEEQGITTLAFATDSGLRSLPLAVLNDGEGFLVERFSLGLIPSLSLVDTTHVDIRNSQVLVAGTSEFIDQSALPATQVEIQTIQDLWPSKALQDSDFTVSELVAQRQQNPYGIVHLSTHGEFTPGAIDNSYIQFANERLPVSQIRELGWHDPTAELVTLSACQTALGNPQAELGFAGFAVQTGVKSVLASLWKVSDVGTTGLMVEFYQELREAPIKSEALRQAQLAMIRGEVSIEADQLRWSGGAVNLPSSLAIEGSEDFSHPFYWSAFTLVGSPW